MELILNIDQKQKTSYCIPMWLRDEQIKLNIENVKGRIESHENEKRDDPIALVGYGGSINDTWKDIKDYKYIFSCSGSHKYLIEHGIIPTYHCEVDPRKHKVELIGQPHKDVEYLIASTCHMDVFKHLENYNVKLWHVFDSTEDAIRTLPSNEWALTGGCSVGVRMITLSRFLGFTNLHIFGMDGCESDSGKHAAAHPMQPKKHSTVNYCNVYGCPMYGTVYKTTQSMLTVAQNIWHELDQLPDVKPTFHGEGLIQHMNLHYTPKFIDKKKAAVAFNKPELISATYCDLNRQLHSSNLAYGIGGNRHVETVKKIAAIMDKPSILDYGCGKGYLAKELTFPIWEYDPAIEGKEGSPRPADIVICTDVLEHIEPDKLLVVLDDLRRCVKQVGFFTIHTGAAKKNLADGRNTHLIQNNKNWWKKRLNKFFHIGVIKEVGPELHVVVAPKLKVNKKAA